MGVPTNARILEVDSNEEIGDYIVMDLGNGCTVTCSQLKEVCAAEGGYLKERQTLGYVLEPTRYHSVEGISISLESEHQDKMVDPLNYTE